MAQNLNTLYFGLGLDTKQFEDDLKKAREAVEKMHIKAELDVEIPDISIAGFEKKIKELNDRLAKLQQANSKANYGLNSPEQQAFRQTSDDLNKRINQYKTYIERLKNVNLSAGGADVGFSVSGEDKVFEVIERVKSELAALNKGVDIKLNIGGGDSDRSFDEISAEIERLTKGVAEMEALSEKRATADSLWQKYTVEARELEKAMDEVMQKQEKFFSKRDGTLKKLSPKQQSEFEELTEEYRKYKKRYNEVDKLIDENFEIANGSSFNEALDLVRKYGGNELTLRNEIKSLEEEKNAVNNLQEKLRELAGLDLTIDANTEEAERKIKDLREELNKLENVNITVVLNNDESVLANLDKMRLLMEKLNVPITISIAGDSLLSEASNSVNSVKQKLDQMTADLFNGSDNLVDYNVKVKANEAYLISSVKSILDRHAFTAKINANDFQKDVEKEIKEALKVLQGKGIELNTKADADILIKSISKALRGQEFEIGVVVTKANATKAVKKALAEAADLYAGKEALAITKEAAIIAKREADARKANAKAMEYEANARKKNAQATREEARATGDATESAGDLLDMLGLNLGHASQLRDILRDAFSLYGIKRFAEQVITIGGEFEKQKTALKSILGDAAQAEVIYSQIKNLAVKSPFEFKDLTSYAKQLSAFSIPYNELFDTTKRLADISAGLGVDMSRIILAFGQVRSAAVLRGQELRQFTEAGIPLVQELANRFTELEGQVVSTGEVFDRISKRMVSFEMVKDILFDMTEEGGKFFEMQEELADTLAGKWANLKDAYDIMLSEIAEGNSGLLKGVVGFITSSLNNWKEIGSVLAKVAVVLGSFKVTLFAVNTSQAYSIILTAAKTNATIADTAAQLANNAAYSTGAIKMAQFAGKLGAAWRALGAGGPIALGISAFAAITTAIVLATRETDRFKKSIEETSSEISGNLKSDISEFERLVRKVGKSVEGTEEHGRALNEIKTKYGALVGDIDNVANAYEYLQGKVESVTNAMRVQAKADFINRNNEVSREKLTDTYNREEAKLTKRLRGMGFSPTDAVSAAGTLVAKAMEFIRENEDVNVYSNDFVYELRDVARELGIDYGDKDYSNWLHALSSIRSIANAEQIRQLEEKHTATMADALFGAPDEPDPLNGWRKSVEDFIKSLEGKDAEVYKALFPQVPKNDEKTLKDWAQGVLKLYDESLADVELYRKQKKESPELLDEDMMKAEETRLSAYTQLIKRFNLEIFREGKGGGGGESDDPVADMWKERVSQLEKAISTYKKWKDVLGSDAAIEKVKGSDAFKEIFSDENLANILTDPNSVWKYIQNQLGGTDKQRELSFELGVKIEETDQAKLKADADRLFNNLKDALERAAASWNIYEDLLKVGIDKNTASSIAGNIMDDSKLAMLNRMLEEALIGSGVSAKDVLGGADVSGLANKEWVSHLRNEINKENIKIKEDSAKLLTELVKKHRDYEQQVVEIERKKTEEIKAINESNLSDEDKKRLVAERERNAQEELAKAKFEEFKRTSDWVKVFDDLDRVSTATLNDMIVKIEEFIRGGVESEEVLKQIIEGLRKVKAESNERNPFGAITRAVATMGNAYQAKKYLAENPDATANRGIQRGEEDNAIKDAKKDLENAFNEIKNKFGELSNVVSSLSEIFEDFGNHSLSAFAEVLDKMSSTMSSGASIGGFFGGSGGIIGGFIGATVGAFAGLFSAAEAATQKEIEASDARREEMEAYRSVLEGLISNSLTGLYDLRMTNSTRTKLESIAKDYQTRREAYGYDINSDNINLKFHDDANFPWETDRKFAYSGKTERMLIRAIETDNAFLAELALLYAERDEYAAGHVKDDDFEKRMEEYNAKIGEMTEFIMAELYSIDFQDWASRLTDSIVDAWVSGEDAALAYKNTVGEILRDVMANVVQQEIIGAYISENVLPLIEEFVNKGGIVDNEFFSRLGSAMQGVGEAVELTTEALDEAEKKANEYGFSLKGATDEGESLSSAIKGVTEDTANLLASYLNAVRQDVSVQRAEIAKLVDDAIPQISVLTYAQLQQLTMIQQNTKITADRITEMNNNFNAVINGTKKVNVK